MSGILEIPSSCPESDVRLNADFAGFDGIDIDAVHLPPEQERQRRYIERMAAWLEDSPGATPMEIGDARARIREEEGL